MQYSVSVIMSAYNCEGTLRESIDSLLSQSFTDWSLTVCDDGSTDGTFEVLREYERLYPDKIKVIQNAKNLKLAASLNRCLEHSKGEFIARMDADDISAFDRFEKQIEFLKKHPECDLVGCSMQRFDERGKTEIINAVPSPDRYTLRRSVPFFHATVMARRTVYEKLGGYTVLPRTERAEDCDLWFRFYKEGLCGKNLPDVLYFVRENKASIRRRTAKSRINALKTYRYGFALLDYPKHWIVSFALKTYLKILVPKFLIVFYRNIKHR